MSYNQGMNLNMFDMNTNSNLTIEKVILIPTKSYRDVSRRSYEVNVNDGNLEKIMGVVERAIQFQEVTAAGVAKGASNILKISDVPTEKVNIVNGWSTVRLRFLLIASTPISAGKEISYVQGYSDYYDPSMLSGAIDPQMMFTINSITTVIQTTRANTNFIDTRISSSFNILYDPTRNSYSVEDTTMEHKLLRPKDVHGDISTLKINETNNIMHEDVRSRYGTIPQVSSRDNGVPAEFMSKMINSFNTGLDYSAASYSEGSAFTTASDMLAETDLDSIPFMLSLIRLTGNVTGVVRFNLDTLAKINPNVASNINLIDNNTQMVSNNIINGTDSEDLGAISIEGTIAATVIDSCNSILADECLSSIDFSITNMTSNSQLVHAVSNAASFINGLDTRPYIGRFINKFKMLTMPGITQNNLIGVNLFIHVDTLGESVVTVSVNNAPEVVFRTPTFCNSLYSSNVTTNHKHDQLVADMAQVLTVSNYTY